MDGLIVVLLIIIGLAAKSSKKKKKQAQKQRERQAGFGEISAAPPPKARPALDKIADALEFMDEKAGQVKIPYSKQEWAKFLNSAAAEKPAPSRAKATASAEGAPAQVMAAQRLRPAAQHSEGESQREHAGHRQRILEEETRLRKEREGLKELRNVNLKKLRSAVVMSEVLGKPVALRGRR